MQKDLRLVRSAAKAIQRAARLTLNEYDLDELTQETSITDRFLARAVDGINSLRPKECRWQAHTLKSHGRGAAESKVGADFQGLLSIDLPNLRIKKGFLAQAKIQTPNVPLTAAGWARLHTQCARMLAYTPDSFVFVYSSQDMVVVPALAIGPVPEDLFSLHYRSVSRFFELHFECFIGDSRFQAATEAALLAVGASSRRSRVTSDIDAGIMPDEKTLLIHVKSKGHLTE